MATSRFAHYLKVIARDKIGSFMEVEDCQAWLERWIANYVSADPKPSAEAKARYPLREAKIEVKEIPGAPGSYNAVAWLRPWLQLEELDHLAAIGGEDSEIVVVSEIIRHARCEPRGLSPRLAMR